MDQDDHHVPAASHTVPTAAQIRESPSPALRVLRRRLAKPASTRRHRARTGRTGNISIHHTSQWRPVIYHQHSTAMECSTHSSIHLNHHSTNKVSNSSHRNNRSTHNSRLTSNKLPASPNIININSNTTVQPPSNSPLPHSLRTSPASGTVRPMVHTTPSTMRLRGTTSSTGTITSSTSSRAARILL